MTINDFTNYQEILAKQIKKDINNLLSLGCGKMPIEHIFQAKNILGVEWADDFLNISKEKGIVIKYDFTDIYKILVDKSFDTVLMFDSLEHIEKNNGLKLLKELENKIKHQIIIFCPIQEKLLPLGHLKYHQDNHKRDNTPLGEHLSTWKPEDFNKLGFQIVEYSPNYHKEKGYGAVLAIKNL